MVRFLGLLQLRLLNGLCPDFGTVRRASFVNRVQNYPVVYYGLLCGMLFGHLYATIGLKDEVVIT